MKKATILFSLLCVVGLCSCNGKSKSPQETGANNDIVKRTFMTMYTYTPEPGQHYGISAEIKSGKVYVTVKPDEFEKAPFAGGMDYRLNETTYEVHLLPWKVLIYLATPRFKKKQKRSKSLLA